MCLGYRNSTGRARKETGIFKISAKKNARPYFYTANAAKAKRAVKMAHQQSCDGYVSNTENDVQARQLYAYKIMKHLSREKQECSRHTGDWRKGADNIFQETTE
jgi:hypothetical protein